MPKTIIETLFFARTNEMNREIRRKERAEREVKQLKGDLDSKNDDIDHLNHDKVDIQSNVNRLEVSLNEQRSTNEGLVKQLVNTQGLGSISIPIYF